MTPHEQALGDSKKEESLLTGRNPRQKRRGPFRATSWDCLLNLKKNCLDLTASQGRAASTGVKRQVKWTSDLTKSSWKWVRL